MKKNVFVVLVLTLFVFSPLAAQSILKKVGEAAKKVTKTEQPKETNSQGAAQSEYTGPVSVKIESTRIIGGKLMISGKMQSSEDIRLMGSKASAITPDGDTYESKEMWWGGSPTSFMSLDKNMAADINYAFDLTFDVKSKAVTEITSLALEMFNHTAQKRFKITLKDLKVPVPVDPVLADPSVTELSKEVYMRWIKVEETANSFTLSFVTENKGSKDQEIQFYSYNKAKITDNEGNSCEADITLRNNVNFPAGTPVAGSITLNKPLKLSAISLIEFSSKYFNYRIRKVVLPN